MQIMQNFAESAGQNWFRFRRNRRRKKNLQRKRWKKICRKNFEAEETENFQEIEQERKQEAEQQETKRRKNFRIAAAVGISTVLIAGVTTGVYFGMKDKQGKDISDEDSDGRQISGRYGV